MKEAGFCSSSPLRDSFPRIGITVTQTDDDEGTTTRGQNERYITPAGIDNISTAIDSVTGANYVVLCCTRATFSFRRRQNWQYRVSWGK